MGTPEFAIPGLDEIYRRGINVAAIVTRPDRPAGRGRKLTASPIKERGLALGLKVWQPTSLKNPDFLDLVRKIGPELFVVSAYGKFIPSKLLAVAPHSGINLHPSLLPRYRGAAPIQWSLINGDNQTGVTVIEVAEKMDAGAIYAQRPVDILPEDNAASLSRRLAETGGDLLADVIEQIAAGGIRLRTQDESKVTFAPRITKSDGWVDWQDSAININNRIRAFNPWPGAITSIYTSKGVKILKIIQAQVINKGAGKAGEILHSENDLLIIATGNGSLRLLKIQLEGKRPLPVADFLRGQQVLPGQILGIEDGKLAP